jgi:hypothetical protein
VREFRITFGQRYRTETHPLLGLAHPDGWVTIEAPDYDTARAWAVLSLEAPMFACHQSIEGAEQACAGWLATHGWDHIGVRMNLIAGQIPADALEPGPDWPQLWPDFDTMVEQMAGPWGACRIRPPESRT